MKFAMWDEGCPAKSLSKNCDLPPPVCTGGCNKKQTDEIFEHENINQENFYSNIDEMNWIEEEIPEFHINEPECYEVQDESFLKI
ncbi:hypothetical protein [Trichormus azollae]|nr:hypothetical protein [Trichormus azollae]